jgi:putative membrane protein
MTMWWRLFVRWIITSVAVAVAILVVPGIEHTGGSALWAIGVTAAVLGLANAIIRPILAFLSCGCIVATLGLFMLVINAVVLMLAGWVSANVFHTGFQVNGFWPAFWGSIVISVVSFLLSILLPDPQDDQPSYQS